MTSTTASSSPALSARLIAQIFVDKYYSVLSTQTEALHQFYDQQDSVLSWPGAPIVVGYQDIARAILELNFRPSTIRIKSVDAQESVEGSILIVVAGSMQYPTALSSHVVNFVQTFVVARKQAGTAAFYVRNDVLKYIEEDIKVFTRDSRPQIDTELSINIAPHPLLSSPMGNFQPMAFTTQETSGNMALESQENPSDFSGQHTMDELNRGTEPLEPEIQSNVVTPPAVDAIAEGYQSQDLDMQVPVQPISDLKTDPDVGVSQALEPKLERENIAVARPGDAQPINNLAPKTWASRLFTLNQANSSILVSSQKPMAGNRKQEDSSENQDDSPVNGSLSEDATTIATKVISEEDEEVVEVKSSTSKNGIHAPSKSGASSTKKSGVFENSIFVNKLPENTSVADLKDMFSTFGLVDRVDLKRPKNQAFIFFKQSSAVSEVLNAPSLVLKGETLVVAPHKIPRQYVSTQGRGGLSGTHANRRGRKPVNTNRQIV